jgi:hypothetical protein
LGHTNFIQSYINLLSIDNEGASSDVIRPCVSLLSFWGGGFFCKGQFVERLYWSKYLNCIVLARFGAANSTQYSVQATVSLTTIPVSSPRRRRNLKTQEEWLLPKENKKRNGLRQRIRVAGRDREEEEFGSVTTDVGELRRSTAAHGWAMGAPELTAAAWRGGTASGFGAGRGRLDRWDAGSAPEKLWAPTTTTDRPTVVLLLLSWLSSADADDDA